MAVYKVAFLMCVVLVASVNSQQQNQRTRGNYGGGFGFNNPGFGGGGFPGGGFPGGGIPGGGFHGGVGSGFAGGVGGGVYPGAGIGGFPGGAGGFVQPTGFPGGTVGGLSHATGSSECRYWCKTPEGQAYCCESSYQPANHPVAAVVDKPGLCPPVRAVCPLRSNIGAPSTCSKHGDCFNADRCCFDRCLGEHVCKQPVY